MTRIWSAELAAQCGPTSEGGNARQDQWGVDRAVASFHTACMVAPYCHRVNIYVGNISYNTSEDDLRDLFARYGEVSAVRVITDRDTGRSKGFGFVEMSDDTQAKEAIGALDSNDFMGRDIRVNEARPREPR